MKNEQEIDLAGFHIRVFHTPGHTVGGCCYYFPYQNVVFSGDTLFCTSVGRTDFPKGSAAQIIRSVPIVVISLCPVYTVVSSGSGRSFSLMERMIVHENEDAQANEKPGQEEVKEIPGETIQVDFSDRVRTKNQLKQMLYRMLCDYTKRTLPWGNLTGIRPTKIPMKLLEEGKSREEIYRYMKDTYLDSDIKTVSVVIINFL